MTLLKISKSTFLLFVVLSFAACSSPTPQSYDTNTDYTPQVTEEPTDCYEVKENCMQMVRDNVPQILEAAYAEQQENNNQEIDAQKMLFLIQSLAFMSDVQEMETYLKNNCPEMHKTYEEELSTFIAIELLVQLNNHQNENNTEN
jgi:hypothetical protein